jgi:hypothetical protein
LIILLFTGSSEVKGNEKEENERVEGEEREGIWERYGNSCTEEERRSAYKRCT